MAWRDGVRNAEGLPRATARARALVYIWQRRRRHVILGSFEPGDDVRFER
jgi:hypothetical protein